MKTIATSIRLKPSERLFLESKGEGNISLGLKRCMEKAGYVGEEMTIPYIKIGDMKILTVNGKSYVFAGSMSEEGIIKNMKTILGSSELKINLVPKEV